MLVQIPPLLTTLCNDLERISRGDKPVNPNYLVITARNTGKTTTTLSVICSLFPFAKKPIRVNIFKPRQQRLYEIVEDIQNILSSFGYTYKFNKGDMRITCGNLTIRCFLANETNKTMTATGISIPLDILGVVNLFDEVQDIHPRLASQYLGSMKTRDETPRLNIYLGNPWSPSNTWVRRWTIGMKDWNEELGSKPPYFREKVVGDTCYIGASIFANPLCPETLINSIIDSNSYDQTLTAINIFGCMGVGQGRIFDNMNDVYKPEQFIAGSWITCGVDIGWTDIKANGGATCMEAFLFSASWGMCGIDEYYHHNEEQIINGDVQRRLILDHIEKLWKKYQKRIMVYVDDGGGDNIHTAFAKEWKQRNIVGAQVYFFGVTTSQKIKWKVYDRITFINQALGIHAIQVSRSFQPHLYDDLRGAVWKEKPTILVEQNPEPEHKYTDTIIGGLSYCLITSGGKAFLERWKNNRM